MAHAGFPRGLGTTVEAVAERVMDDSNKVLILEIVGVAVGEMNYRGAGEGTTEIGIKICQHDHLEKGYGTRFLKILIDYLFVELGFQKIVLDTNLTNTRAQHVYEKLGFHRVAVHIDAWKDQLGAMQSTVDFELTREEFLRQPRQ